MSWKETLEPLLLRLPAVESSPGRTSFENKLKWTGGILVMYFLLSNIELFGLAAGTSGTSGYLQTIMAASQGSVLQLGIGPIVTGSIVMQLLNGADLLGLDTQSDPRDKRLYQGLQKLVVIIMAFVTAAPMVFSGAFLKPSAEVASALGVGEFTILFIMYLQVVAGGIFIMLMDEVVSKWGIGSGVGLFIIAGISQKLMGGLFGIKAITGVSGIIPIWIGILTGAVKTGEVLGGPGLRNILFGRPQLIAILTTILIFLVVVYAESVRVELPVSHSRVNSAGGRYPVKLIYASVLPMILVRALQSNIQIFGRALDSTIGLPAYIASYSNGQAVSGLLYYLSPVRSPRDWMWWLASTSNEPWQIILHVFTDLFIMVVGGAVFAVFWVETTNMGPDAVAQKIKRSGLQFDGFRRNSGVIQRVLERYIPHVTVLGGAIVGALAVLANMLGTIGQVSGTGLLLTVTITYKLYEEIGEEKLKEMNPMVREFLE